MVRFVVLTLMSRFRNLDRVTCMLALMSASHANKATQNVENNCLMFPGQIILCKRSLQVAKAPSQLTQVAAVKVSKISISMLPSRLTLGSYLFLSCKRLKPRFDGQFVWKFRSLFRCFTSSQFPPRSTLSNMLAN